MERKINKVWCMFEQSGCFKNEFKKLGIDAVDLDIQNNHGETDYQLDLFAEIENAYDGKKSVFDDITQEDIVMAFFPCIFFEALQMTYYDLSTINLRGKTKKQQYDIVIERIENREKFLILLYKLCAIAETRGLRLIIENPATQPNYLLLTQTFVKKPTLIDNDRTLRGDYFKKPTAYWFFNIEPTNGHSYKKNPNPKIINKCKQGAKAGICSEERSMIAPDYAKNFIADFILGEPNENTLLTLF